MMVRHVAYSILASPLNMSLEDKMEVDNRSIYVGNVSAKFISDLSNCCIVICNVITRYRVLLFKIHKSFDLLSAG